MKMTNILNANFILHHRFDKLRDFKGKSFFVGAILSLLWFVIWVTIIAFSILLLNDESQGVRIIGAVCVFIIVLSRLCAIISESFYRQKKERKIKLNKS
jgi:uncharacterized membrane protein (DUF485 family)